METTAFFKQMRRLLIAVGVLSVVGTGAMLIYATPHLTPFSATGAMDDRLALAIGVGTTGVIIGLVLWGLWTTRKIARGLALFPSKR